MHFFDFIAAIAWPSVALFLGIRYLPLLKKMENLSVKFPSGAEVSASGPNADEKIRAALRDMDDVFRHMLKDEQIRFFLSLANTDKQKRVFDVFPNFTREDKVSMGTLRALRGLGLIEPVNGGKWEGEKLIYVTPFGERKTSSLKAIVDH
jgi:hypothetical protein